jgi:hypothetical protein
MEQIRILKPDGVIYLNAPSNGTYHTYPTDNWRFYPDASKALSDYANFMGFDSVVLESFIGKQNGEGDWNDFVGVFVKDKKYHDLYPERIWKNIPENLKPNNIWSYGEDKIINYNSVPEDVIKLQTCSAEYLSLKKSSMTVSIILLLVLVILIITKTYKRRTQANLS